MCDAIEVADDVASHSMPVTYTTLLDSGIRNLEALVLEGLTQQVGSIIRTTLAALASETGAESPYSDLSVLVIRRDR